MLDVKTSHPDVAETLKEFEAYLQIEQPERLLDGKSPWTNIDLTLEQVKKNLSGSEPMTFYFSDMMFNAQTIAMGFERDSCDHRMLQGQEKKVIGFSAR